MTSYLALSAGGLNYVVEYTPPVVVLSVAAPTSPLLVAKDAAIGYTPTVTSGSVSTWSASGLPAGASFNTETGAISGTCTAYGIGIITVRAEDAIGGYDEIYLAYHIYASIVDVDAAYFVTNGLSLSGTNICYRLTETINFDGAGPELALADSANCSLSLNGHAITYDNAAPPAVVNGSFETGSGATASGWTVNASYARTGPGLSFAAGAKAWDGDYALHLTLGSGAAARFATSDTPVTLTAGQTLCLQMGTWGVNGSQVGNSNRYAELVGPVTHQTTKYTGNIANNSIIQVGTFTVGVGEDGDYTLRCVCDENVSSSGVVSFDDVRLTYASLYGVRPRDNTGVFGPGSISQAGYAYNSPVIDGLSADSFVVAYLTATSQGHGCRCLDQPSGNGRNSWVVHNTFTNNATMIRDRTTFDGYTVLFESGVVAKNTITAAPQGGIARTGGDVNAADSVKIAFNQISLQSRFTNGFGILVRQAQQNSDVFNNSIDTATVATDGGRGISLLYTTVASGKTARCHHNTILVKELANNQEYRGGVLNGCYGIQCEYAGGWEVDNNSVTARSYTDGTDHVQATPFRMNGLASHGADGATPVNVHDNTFTVVETNVPSDYDNGHPQSQVYLCYGDQPSASTFQDNTSVITGPAHLFALSDGNYYGSTHLRETMTGDTFTQSPFETTTNGYGQGPLVFDAPTYGNNNTQTWIATTLAWYRLGVEDTTSIDPAVT